ncbi:MAG TPA: hypothetical protein VFO55_07080 [Gemmatimonadaceae bacterium]|nr:hypothetical protein [Gemmatimonadaceae bacterium]
MKSVILLAAALAGAGSLGAQTLETRTIELRHLKPIEAVKLLSPYVRSTGGGVFDVSEKIPIVTVRDTPENLAIMEKVLAKYDHTPATIRLVFQLIEADTGPRAMSVSGGRSQLSIDLDSTLRSVLKFPAYRMLAQGVATAGEFSWVTQQLANAEGGSTYDLTAEIGTVRIDDRVTRGPKLVIDGVEVDSSASGTVHINVQLKKTSSMIVAGGNARRPEELIISTGLDVPLGHMVVLGTAATRKTGVALILTVKPELVRAK